MFFPHSDVIRIISANNPKNVWNFFGNFFITLTGFDRGKAPLSRMLTSYRIFDNFRRSSLAHHRSLPLPLHIIHVIPSDTPY